MSFSAIHTQIHGSGISCSIRVGGKEWIWNGAYKDITTQSGRQKRVSDLTGAGVRNGRLFRDCDLGEELTLQPKEINRMRIEFTELDKLDNDRKTYWPQERRAYPGIKALFRQKGKRVSL